MTVSLLRACDDAELLDWPLHPRQRELLEALDGPETTHIWAAGRRGGKTSLAALLLLHGATMRPDLDERMRPGEARYCVAVANKLDQARLLLNAARSIAERSPLLSGLLDGSTEDELRFALPNGRRSVLKAFPCTARGGRGFPISHLALDEFAHFFDSDGNSAAESIWAALTPAVAQFGAAGRTVALSTPAGPAGKFAELFQAADSGANPSARAFQIPSAELNPALDPDWLEARREEDDSLFRTEFLAEFVGGVGQFFDLERIAVTGYPEVPPEQGSDWVLAVDPAVQQDPFAAVVVGRARDDHERLLVGAVEAWAPQRAATFEERSALEAERFEAAIALARRYDVTRVVHDQWAAKLVEDRFRREGFSTRLHNLSGTSRWQAFSQLRGLLYSGQLELPDVPELLAELRQIRVKHAGASSTIETPRTSRGHCDRAIALALAAAAHGTYGQRPEVGEALRAANERAREAGTITGDLAGEIGGSARRTRRGPAFESKFSRPGDF